MNINRIFLIVLDGVGVGELPDAARYGDSGSNSIGNTAQKLEDGLHLPVFERLGLGKLTKIKGVSADVSTGIYGKMIERSAGKDTTTGHWEMSGIILEQPFPVYPNGFPEPIIAEFIKQTGRGVIGNKVASGTVIIDELGAKHLQTGDLIVYTSADSVFQIAAHEDIVSNEELYRYCEIARRILTGGHAVGRVIARPFTGKPGAFYRTAGRKDFSLEPIGPTVLDRVKAAGLTVYGVGKIEDIFCNRGLTDSNHTHNNQETLEFVSHLIKQDFKGLVFANCIDFDMVYGHRNDYLGYAQALQEVDRWLDNNLKNLREGDLIIITGDHGCDPTTPSTDHSREYTPLLITGPNLPEGIDLGIRNTFADIAASICYWFGLEPLPVGEEFASLIK
ncbi:MAG TPA: phosphopentomutase [Bacillota bacterium]|nr:phosphopentomutase [Bacillota bacterium]HOL08539.1 phosphopentomutase [Bacillota bacterium]HPO96980.1 phosphopentomutase [Bacillota bacterium]